MSELLAIPKTMQLLYKLLYVVLLRDNPKGKHMFICSVRNSFFSVFFNLCLTDNGDVEGIWMMGKH